MFGSTSYLNLKTGNELQRRSTKSAKNHYKLNNVEPALTNLVFRHEGLRPPQCFSKLSLCPASRTASLPKHALQDSLLRGEEAFLHSCR
jgi:hypothetical protein